jgi:VIT1/CCC1 family predicted Fe2+/Mn2+ transporter
MVWWRRLRERVEPAAVRERVTDVNDGILAVAGFSEGLVGSGLATESVFGIIAVSALAGSVAVAAARLGEAIADREVQLDLVAEEQRQLALSPEEEVEELAEHFRAKGVSPATARQVAEELSAADALSAQLENEYGIRELTPALQPWLEALGSGLSFLIGAGVPLAVAWLYPGSWLEEFTLLAVLVSLVITALVLARLGQTRIWRTLARSVLIGLGSLGTSYLVAALIF